MIMKVKQLNTTLPVFESVNQCDSEAREYDMRRFV